MPEVKASYLAHILKSKWDKISDDIFKILCPFQTDMVERLNYGAPCNPNEKENCNVCLASPAKCGMYLGAKKRITNAMIDMLDLLDDDIHYYELDERGIT